MTKDEYREYLASTHWDDTRRLKLIAAGNRCEECFAEGCPLEVHHLHYRSLWREEMSHLRCCCRRCHQTLHDAAEIARHNVSWEEISRRLAAANRRWQLRCW